MNKNKMELLGGTLATMMFLSGCKPANETNKTPVVDPSASPSGPSTKETPYVTYSPTKEALLKATPTRPDMGGGAYSSEQQTLIESGAFKDSEQALTAWFEYWANASNSPFHPETTDLHYKYVFDSTDKSSGVCLESSAYRGICFFLPIINGEVATVPPTVNGSYEIPVGYGPLQLSDQLSAEQVSALKLDESLTDSVLGYQDGNWVRIKNGQVVGTLDLESAQWKVMPSIQSAIVELSLNTGRTYTISSGEYLIDTFNQAKMAKLDRKTNTWVDTSLEEKYGGVAPENPSVAYVGIEQDGGDAFYAANKDIKFLNINPVWTGNTIETSIDYEGKTIKDICLETVFRDGSGVLHRVLISYISPDLESKAILNWRIADNQTSTGSGFVVGEPLEILKLYSPGEQLNVRFLFSSPRLQMPASGQCYYQGTICSNEYRKNYYIYQKESEQLLTIANGLINNSEINTDNIVLPSIGMGADLRFYVETPISESSK